MSFETNNQRRLTAIMFTDIVGYSALIQKNEILALELLEEHNKKLRPLFQQFGGKEIKTIGDAFLVEFESSYKAVQCAIEIQSQLHHYNSTAPAGHNIQIRIGIHVGDVVHKDGDVFGDGVNIASRIEALAKPGGICISKDVFRQIHNKSQTLIIRLGKGQLKNIKIETTVYRIVLPWEETSIPFFERTKFTLQHHPLITSLIVLLITIFGVLLYFFITPKSIEINLAATIKTLSLSFTNISAVSISSDGNWIAFAAADKNNRWNVYYMNTSTNELHCLTTDSLKDININSVDISPDGSMICYGQLHGRNTENIYKNTLYTIFLINGESKIINDNAANAQWSPDGKRIGYLLFPPQIKKQQIEFWTMAANGTDKKLEFVDSISKDFSKSSNFSWSPDGKSIVWIKRISQNIQELWSYDLEKKQEQQLTFDKKNIKGVQWITDGIIFSSDRSGSFNLWMLNITTNTYSQITKGGGIDVSPTVSSDKKKLSYIQMQYSSNLWITKVDSVDSKQITFENTLIGKASFSPDGKKIVFSMQTMKNDSIKNSNLYTIDRDGTHLKQVTNINGFLDYPIWSPDGKKIAYNYRTSSSSHDSNSIYLLDINNPQNVKFVSKTHSGYLWIDSKKLYLFNNTQGFIYYLDKEEIKPFFEDSTFTFPLIGEEKFLVYDIRSATNGIWIKSQNSLKKIFSADYGVLISPDRKTLLINKSDDINEVWKLQHPYLKPTLLKNTLPYLNTAYMNYDGTEMVYFKYEAKNKLVLIEQPFK